MDDLNLRTVNALYAELARIRDQVETLRDAEQDTRIIDALDSAIEGVDDAMSSLFNCTL